MHGFWRKPELSEVGSEPSPELRRRPPAAAAGAGAAPGVRGRSRGSGDASANIRGGEGVVQ